MPSRDNRKQVQPVIHRIYQGGGGMKIENEETTMTFTNRLKIGNKRIKLEDFSAEEQAVIANRLIYQPLTTIANVEVIQTA